MLSNHSNHSNKQDIIIELESRINQLQTDIQQERNEKLVALKSYLTYQDREKQTNKVIESLEKRNHDLEYESSLLKKDMGGLVVRYEREIECVLRNEEDMVERIKTLNEHNVMLSTPRKKVEWVDTSRCFDDELVVSESEEVLRLESNELKEKYAKTLKETAKLYEKVEYLSKEKEELELMIETEREEKKELMLSLNESLCKLQNVENQFIYIPTSIEKNVTMDKLIEDEEPTQVFQSKTNELIWVVPSQDSLTFHSPSLKLNRDLINASIVAMDGWINLFKYSVDEYLKYDMG